MSLYVRVNCDFWTNRKTLRLRAAIGDAALWVPPRLWAYAATNQADGVFSDYTAEEIALAIGYSGDAEALLQALLQACFMDTDPLRIHDWEAHNGYHATFHARAKAAAAARWAKQPPPQTPPNDKRGEDKKGKETSNASSMLVASEGQKDLVLEPPTQPPPKTNGWHPTPTQQRLNRFFNRRDGTKWSDKELKALKDLGDIDEGDFAVMEAYYTMRIPEKTDYRRRDMLTLLNNWPGELDRAKRHGGVKSVEQKQAEADREIRMLEGSNPWDVCNRT